jgi:outer membrane beta-barrel protein
MAVDAVSMRRRGPHGAAALTLALTLVLAASAARAADEPAPAAATPAAAPDSVAPAAPMPPPADAPAVANPRPTVTRKVRLVHEARNVLRTGPGNDYAIAGVYPKGDEFTVIAKSGDWYNVQLNDTETGWVHASLVKAFDDMSDLEFRPNAKLYSRTGSFILSAYTGGYSFDRKSNSLVLGGRLGYYIFDRLQFETTVAWTHIDRPAEIVESLFGLTLEEEKFDMLFYNLNLTWELLPGRQMVPYLSGGAGSSIMLGSSEPAINFGGGVAMFLSKRTAVRWEVRDYRFETGADNARRENNNIEFTLGTSYLF